MCSKMFLLVALVYVAVYPEVWATSDVILPQGFDQILTDFIVQYHNDKATDICKTPVEKYINEDFTKSAFYERLQLEKYFANDSKTCENVCFNTKYEFEVKLEVTTVPDITVTPTVTSSIQPTSTTIRDENGSATNSETTDLEETTTMKQSSGGEEEKIQSSPNISVRAPQTQQETEEDEEEKVQNSPNISDGAFAPQTQQETEGGKKTAIIVTATVLAVGASAAAAYFVVNWVKSGTYVFPDTPNA